MSITNPWNNQPAVTCQRVRIVTVDPATNRIEGVQRDGAVLQITMMDSPLVFRWPIEGETWSVKRMAQYWTLDHLVDDPEDQLPISDLQPGEAKLAAEKIYDRDGRLVVAIDPDTVGDGEYLRRVGDAWTTQPITGGTGSDAYYLHVQTAPASVWVIPHNLGKYPAVTVMESTGEEVTPDVHHDSINQVTITFGGAMTGRAALS